MTFDEQPSAILLYEAAVKQKWNNYIIIHLNIFNIYNILNIIGYNDSEHYSQSGRCTLAKKVHQDLYRGIKIKNKLKQ